MHPLAGSGYLLGTDLDEVLEGFAMFPEERVETAAHPRANATLDVADRRQLDTDAFVRKLESSPDGVPRLRNRYHGQPRRGRQTFEQLDEQDHAEAMRCIAEGMRGLAYYRSAKGVPRAQREDIKREAIAKLRLGQRWLEEIAARNGGGPE